MSSSSKLASRSHQRTLQGIRQIEAKITDLQHQYDHLLKQRQQDIAQLITTLDLASLEDQTLVGGFLFIKDKVASQASIVEDWQHAGARFLRRFKPQKHRPSQKTETAAPKPQSSQKSS